MKPLRIVCSDRAVTAWGDVRRPWSVQGAASVASAIRDPNVLEARVLRLPRIAAENYEAECGEG